jgi:hypothetical protein
VRRTGAKCTGFMSNGVRVVWTVDQVRGMNRGGRPSNRGRDKGGLSRPGYRPAREEALTVPVRRQNSTMDSEVGKADLLDAVSDGRAGDPMFGTQIEPDLLPLDTSAGIT